MTIASSLHIYQYLLICMLELPLQTRFMNLTWKFLHLKLNLFLCSFDKWAPRYVWTDKETSASYFSYFLCQLYSLQAVCHCIFPLLSFPFAFVCLSLLIMLLCCFAFDCCPKWNVPNIAPLTAYPHKLNPDIHISSYWISKICLKSAISFNGMPVIVVFFFYFW